MSLNGELMMAVARFAPNTTLAEADAFIAQVLRLVEEDGKKDLITRATGWAAENFSEKDLTRKIQCIKVLRDRYGVDLGLRDAKDIMDKLTPRASYDFLDHEPVDRDW